jgi:hypothetical protein
MLHIMKIEPILALKTIPLQPDQEQIEWGRLGANVLSLNDGFVHVLNIR